jgi:hypothetical protein
MHKIFNDWKKCSSFLKTIVIPPPARFSFRNQTVLQRPQINRGNHKIINMKKENNKSGKSNSAAGEKSKADPKKKKGAELDFNRKENDDEKNNREPEDEEEGHYNDSIGK